MAYIPSLHPISFQWHLDPGPMVGGLPRRPRASLISCSLLLNLPTSPPDLMQKEEMEESVGIGALGGDRLPALT